MEKASLDFLPYSTESLSISSEVKPEPVPPPNEWKMRKPWWKIFAKKTGLDTGNLEASAHVSELPGPI